jgi:hypothetical protein
MASGVPTGGALPPGVPHTTLDPFTYKGSYDDPVPTIHVGFQPKAALPAGAAASTTTTLYYSMLNHRGASDPHGGFPWFNRPDADAVQPLPYEIGLLRDAYPASDAHWQVSVLNTWFQVITGSTDDAAHQVQLCTPSLGDRFTKNDTTSDACGTGGTSGGSTVVSENEWLRTRFAVANSSTGSMQVTSKLWLSRDDVLDDSDIPANSWDLRTVSAETSQLAEVAFKLPHLPDGTCRPIVATSSQHLNADGTVQPGTGSFDWMPLRGTVCVAATHFCAIPSSHMP